MSLVITISGKARHGKDTVAELLKEKFEAEGKKAIILHYADYLKFIARSYWGWNGEKDEVGRTILQYIGTDKVRETDEDFWVKVVEMLMYVFRSDFDYFIIPDARFPNEIDYLKNEGWQTLALKVVRENFESELTEEQRNHKSETALDDYRFDFIISSDSGANMLNEEVVAFIELGKLVGWFE